MVVVGADVLCIVLVSSIVVGTDVDVVVVVPVFFGDCGLVEGKYLISLHVIIVTVK